MTVLGIIAAIVAGMFATIRAYLRYRIDMYVAETDRMVRVTPQEGQVKQTFPL